MRASKAIKQDTKWVFIKKGTCSRTLFYILNREFGHPHEAEEKAIDPLAGGIMQNGYQCGQLWGASAAVGAEAYRRHNELNIATDITVKTTKNLIESFEKRAETTECEDFIGTKVNNNKDVLKLMVSGKFFKCFKLADRWAPEAIKTAHEGLDAEYENLPSGCTSCASEVVKKMEGTDEQAAMVAGWAGGLGLSGSGCGALSAAVWMATYNYEKKNGKAPYPCPDAEKVLQNFLEVSDYEFECKVITDKVFEDLNEHSRYLEEGGCKNIIEAITKV